MTIRNAAWVAMLVLGAALGTTGRQKVTGLFSSLTYNEEGSDLLGMEVYVVFGADHHVAVVQCAGGEPADPVVVKADADGNRVSFTLPAGLPECGTEFTGTVTEEGLRGRFSGEAKDRWLPRKNGYWQ